MVTPSQDKRIAPGPDRARAAAAPDRRVDDGASETPVPAWALALRDVSLGAERVQRQQEVGRSDDPAELEADRMADDVVAALHSGARASEHPGGPRPSGDPEIGADGGTVSAGLHSAIVSARSDGHGLPGDVRRTMEGALGADLSGVRLHTGPRADEAAARMSARAFTVGSDVFFRGGMPPLGSATGTHLLAHELAHVVQQRPGPVRSHEPVRRADGIVRRSKQSAELLTTLAKPQVFEGPEVELQQSIVAKLEQAIPALQLENETKIQEIDSWFAAKTAGNFSATPEDAKAYQDLDVERRRRMAAHAVKYDGQLLYLGSVVLTDIPAREADEETMIGDAELVTTDHSLPNTAEAVKLPKAAGVEADIVRNTLRTMIAARQIEYLRKSGFVGAQWKIVVEIHYYRSRSTATSKMHKDTLGQTLFVNLNYTNTEEMPGPEFIVNPGLVPTHEDKVTQNLPQTFRDDLGASRKALGRPQKIGTRTLKPHSVVSFVDEAIHHATPLVGHRSIAATDLEAFLLAEPRYRNFFPKAKAVYMASRKPKRGAVFGAKRTPFAKKFTAVPAENRKFWEDLAAVVVEGQPVTRPELMRIGAPEGVDVAEAGDLPVLGDRTGHERLPDDVIDRMLAAHGDEGFRSVSIPSAARADGKTNVSEPFTDDPVKRPVVLKREMSQLALDGRLPTHPEGDRRFFRTWVRAVRV